LGVSAADLAAYFDICRRKRNQVDYDFANVATEEEVNDLVARAHEFQKLVEGWIRKTYPEHAI